jgi:hypothetical protein
MAKHYVFPINGTTILLSVKSAINPRTGAANYLASLPNPIGGNDDGRTALATLQAEAAEETRGKVTIAGYVGPFYRTGQYSFYVSTAFAYNPLTALSGAQQTAIDNANAWWDDTFDMSCEGRCRGAARAACYYCSYLDAHDTGLTLLENTGEVASLNLALLDLTSNQTSAQTLVANSTGIAAPGASTPELEGSHSLQAIRLLSAWVKYSATVTVIKAEIPLTRQHAATRQAAPHAPTVNPQAGQFNAANAQVQIQATAIAGTVLAAAPALTDTTTALLADDADIAACWVLLVAWRGGVALGAAPGARVGRGAFATRVVTLVTQLATADALLV